MKLSKGSKIALITIPILLGVGVAVWYFVIRKKTGAGGSNIAEPDVTTGVFDWVGKGDYEGKMNYYAGIHALEFFMGGFRIKVGDMITLSNTKNWPEMEGKTAKVLKLNPDAATVILDVPAPVGDASGVWTKVG